MEHINRPCSGQLINEEKICNSFTIQGEILDSPRCSTSAQYKEKINQQFYADFFSRIALYSRTSMIQTPGNHENMFETGVIRANEN